MTAPVQASQPSSIHSLAALASRKGRHFGAAVRIEELNAEPALKAAVLRDCSQVTPEIHMMWKALEPQPGRFDYAGADGLLAFADANALSLHGHSLLWGLGTPDWAQARIGRERDWSLVSEHITRTVARYGDRVNTWSVVNEAIDTEGGRDGLRNNVFLRAFGPDYIERALRVAHAAAPHAKLTLNDFSFDYENETEIARRRAFLKLIAELRRRRAPLHGVGLQAHLDLSKGPVRAEPLRAFFGDLAALDLEIAVTELDVQEHNFASCLAQRDQRVAAEAERYLQVALDEPAVTGVTTWGLTDRHSWLEGADKRSEGGEAVASTPDRRNRGLPYDAELRPKPMYWAVQRILSGANVSRSA